MRGLLLLLLLIAFVAGCRKETPRPVLGMDPLLQTSFHERQSELLDEWSGREYRKRILLHLSPLDDLEFIPDNAMKKVEDLYRNKRSDELIKQGDQGSGGLYSSRNTLYAAAKAGGIKEIYWVVPYKFAELAGGGVAIKNFLKTLPSFPNHEEIDRMSISGGCLTGSLNGVKLYVCSPNSLPKFKEPVILTVSGDFFRLFAKEQEASSLRGMRQVYDALSSRQISIESLHLVRGVEEGTGLPVHSYICDQFLQAVRNPQIMEQESAPPLWLARDVPENILNGKEFKLAREEASKSLKKFPDDHPLQMIDIAAQLLMGDVAPALNRAERLAASTPADRNRSESQFLVQLGDMVTETRGGDPDPFYRLALSLHPGWVYAMAHRGNSMLARGKYEEAREQFAALATKRDGFIVRLRRGDVEFYLGKSEEALKYYDSARSLYNDRVAVPMTRENSASLDRMENMYSLAGRSKDAAEIVQWKKQMNTLRQTR